MRVNIDDYEKWFKMAGLKLGILTKFQAADDLPAAVMGDSDCVR